jgi:serine/threonine-protein kinase HipA
VSEAPFAPQDRLSVWWLGDPAQPKRVGEAQLVQGGRSVALRYADTWLAQGFALSEDLPLTRELFVPREKDSAAGALDDARPDRWGERLIRKFQPTPRLSLLEYLLFAGDDRYGALGLSLDEGRYRPWPTPPLPGFAELGAMAEVVRQVLAGEPVPQPLQRLLRPGASLGGAQPKSLLQMEGRAWLLKFNEEVDGDMGLTEHAAMRLAAACGIEVATTRALPLIAAVTGKPAPHALAIERFDRQGSLRLQAMSAHVALRAAGDALGYPEFAQLLRRLLPAADIAAAQGQLFRRMVFNILIDNTDDHEKNHALVRGADGFYALSPAFDVLPAAQGLGYQQMRVGASGHESSIANALSQARAFGLTDAQAQQTVAEIVSQVAEWKVVFQGLNVRDADIDLLAQYLDGAHLREQRASLNR